MNQEQSEKRKIEILTAIYDEGDFWLPRSLIREKWWPEANPDNPRAMQKVLKRYKDQELMRWPLRKRRSKRKEEVEGPKRIMWPAEEVYSRLNFGEPVVTLDWYGAYLVAQNLGIAVEPPQDPHAKKDLVAFSKQLKEKGFIWPHIPRNPRHDTKVAKVRRAFNKSAEDSRRFSIKYRVVESTFHHNPDAVEIKEPGQLEPQTFRIEPDDFVAIVDDRRKVRGLPALIHGLIEVGTGSYSHRALSTKKILGAAAYPGSEPFKRRFLTDDGGGRWFFVASSKERMENVIRTVNDTAPNESYLFFFSHYSLTVNPNNNVFESPVWWKHDGSGPFTLGELGDAEQAAS